MTPALSRPVRRAVFASALAIAAVPLAAGSVEGQGYDMDCKVILCMAGGFPADCADAYSYMIDRITRFPNPLPPFGYCAMSDGSEYTAHRTHHRRLSQTSESGWDCPAGLSLHFSRSNEDDDIFCYSHTTTRERRDGTETIYHGRQPAHAVNYELQITLEPGTEHQWISPLFRLNYSTGYFSQS